MTDTAEPSPPPERDLEAEWAERHPNPSGLPDGHPSKVAQPIPELHHEEGHVDPDETVVESPS